MDDYIELHFKSPRANPIKGWFYMYHKQVEGDYDNFKLARKSIKGTAIVSKYSHSMCSRIVVLKKNDNPTFKHERGMHDFLYTPWKTKDA